MKKTIFAALALIMLILSGCAPEQKTIYIVEQFGTAYAPVALMRELKLLEDKLPDNVNIQWSRLGNTAAIREAMLAGKADIGFMAIPPFLIGLDNGMEWRICSGISSMPMGMTSRDSSIKSLADIGPDERIALPQPGSIQHILLAMAAERELGSPDIFDNRLVSMSHPDGMNALLSGSDITLHFTSAPYLGYELAAGMTLTLTDRQAMGEPFTGIVAVARQQFYDDEPELYAAFYSALGEAVELLRSDPDSAAGTLAPVYSMTREELLAELSGEGVEYSLDVNGLDKFNDFLYRTGYISQKHDLSRLVFEGAPQ